MQINSHSGDTIRLISINGRPSVLKTFTKDVHRATRSVEKQRIFEELICAEGAKIAAVPIEEYQVTEGYSTLRMPYIEGIAGNNYALFGTKSIAESLSKSLSMFLYRSLSSSVDRGLDLSLFLEKFEHIRAAPCKFGLSEKIDKFKPFFYGLPSDIPYPHGYCHGDLTLSNIIHSQRGIIYLIDFLDVFVDSPLQDVAKIRQEFDYGWSFRALEKSSIIKGRIFYQNSMPKAVVDYEKLYPFASKIFLLMNLIRIAPYVHELRTACWLDECLESELTKLGI